MAEKQRILIVDDDANIAELISLYLMKECYETMIVGDGEEALRVFPDFKPNLVLLDLMLPGMDGYQVCRELRTSSQVPIIMLSAKGEIFDKVLGLELGADDYMIKPFDSKELVARVKAVLRRYQVAPAPAPSASEQQGEYVEYPDLIVNLTNYSVIYRGHSVEMPPRSWNCCISWRPRPTRYSPASSFWTISGVTSTSATPAPWTYISSVCGKRSRTTPTGPSPRCGASVTNSR